VTQATILTKILERKSQEVAQRKLVTSLAELDQTITTLEPGRAFTEALMKQATQRRPAVIAEIKKASPSKGIIRKDFDPEKIAISYAENGASCLSILTDVDFFQGEDTYLKIARAACELPVLRKDFVIDPYQIAESKSLQADCVLLIVAALDSLQLGDLYHCALAYGLDVLIEVHNEAELDIALALEPALIGINNRDLHTFNTSLDTTYKLLPKIPENVTVITESGIHVREDVDEMLAHGVYGFLVGEAFMRAANPGEKLQELFFYG